jgi:hypothetical protein
MRTQTDKLLDYIKSSAVLHQHQREKDAEGQLIATWFDYDYAVFMFGKLKDIEGKLLNKDEEELLNILKGTDGYTIKELSTRYKRHSKQWIYDHLDDFKNKGLIEEYEEWDSSANKETTHLRCIFGYSACKLPNSLVLKGFKAGFENQNKIGFKGFKGFIDFLERIDINRRNLGLTSLSLPILLKTIKTTKTSPLEVLN